MFVFTGCCVDSGNQPAEVVMVKTDRNAVTFADERIGLDAAEATMESPPPDAVQIAEAPRPPPPDARWVRGVAVAPGVACGFLAALRAEYVDFSLGATLLFLEREAASQGVVAALATEQTAVRRASDPAATIQELAVRWGFESPPPPKLPALETATAELRVVFRTLRKAKGVAERQTIVFSRLPLGMVFDRVMPMVVSEVKGKAQELGVQLGWEVEAINDLTVEASWDFEKTYGIFTSEAKRCLG